MRVSEFVNRTDKFEIQRLCLINDTRTFRPQWRLKVRVGKKDKVNNLTMPVMLDIAQMRLRRCRYRLTLMQAHAAVGFVATN